jgi:hypothetical protein
MVLAVGLVGTGAHRDRHGFGRDQGVDEARQGAPLDLATADGAAIIADPLAELAEATIAVIDDDAVPVTAAPADQQTRQEEGGTTQSIEAFRARRAHPQGRRPELFRQPRLAELHPLP